jgi:hypothetical protein
MTGYGLVLWLGMAGVGRIETLPYRGLVLGQQVHMRTVGNMLYVMIGLQQAACYGALFMVLQTYRYVTW